MNHILSQNYLQIRSPLAPLNKGGTKRPVKVPLFKGDLGGSKFLDKQTLNDTLLTG